MEITNVKKVLNALNKIVKKGWTVNGIMLSQNLVDFVDSKKRHVLVPFTYEDGKVTLKYKNGEKKIIEV